MPVVTLHQSPEGRIGRAGSLVIVHFRAAATNGFLDALEQTLTQVVSEHQTTCSLNILGQALMKTDESVRQRSVDISSRYEKGSLGRAIIVLGRGLAGVSVRTALSLFFMMSQGAANTKVFSTVDEGLSWLHGLPGQDPLVKMVSAREVEQFIAEPSAGLAGTA